jgi:hypothetical protein
VPSDPRLSPLAKRGPRYPSASTPSWTPCSSLRGPASLAQPYGLHTVHSRALRFRRVRREPGPGGCHHNRGGRPLLRCVPPTGVGRGRTVVSELEVTNLLEDSVRCEVDEQSCKAAMRPSPKPAAALPFCASHLVPPSGLSMHTSTTTAVCVDETVGRGVMAVRPSRLPPIPGLPTHSYGLCVDENLGPRCKNSNGSRCGPRLPGVLGIGWAMARSAGAVDPGGPGPPARLGALQRAFNARL